MLYVADVLRMKAVSVGVVVIKGEMTGSYLAMNKNGRLYGSVGFHNLTSFSHLILDRKTLTDANVAKASFYF